MSERPTAQQPAAAGLPVTAATFAHEVIDSAERVLVDFWAPWCHYCRALAPVLEQIATDQRLKLVTVNQDAEPEIAAHYGIQAVPNMILFENGRPTAQVIGARPKVALEQALGWSRETVSKAVTWRRELAGGAPAIEGSPFADGSVLSC